MDYGFGYIKYSNGLVTGDGIHVNCDKYGNILSITYNNNNVDWDSVKFEDEKISQSVKFFVDTCLRKNNDVVDYDITDKQLICVDQKIQLILDIGVTLKIHGSDYETLYKLMLSER